MVCAFISTISFSAGTAAIRSAALKLGFTPPSLPQALMQIVPPNAPIEILGFDIFAPFLY